MKSKNFSLAVVASFALSAYFAQLAPAKAQGTYRHAASGMTFPAKVGDFGRGKITRFDETGDDIGVGYDLASAAESIVATVYVYPAPSLASTGSPLDVTPAARGKLCSKEFTRRKNEVTTVRAGARLIREGDSLPPEGGRRVPGKMAVFEFDAQFKGEPSQPLHSELYVFCYVGGKWAFEYRFTSPKKLDASGRISAFMKALRWTIPSQ